MNNFDNFRRRYLLLSTFIYCIFSLTLSLTAAVSQETSPTPGPSPTPNPFAFSTPGPTPTPAPVPTLIQDLSQLQNQVASKPLAPFLKDVYQLLRQNALDSVQSALNAIGSDLDFQTHPEAYWTTKSTVAFVQNDCKAAKEAALEGKKLRGSDSDLSYLLGLSAACLQDAKAAKAYLEESLWFDSFRAFPKADAYLALAKILDYLSLRAGATDALDSLLALTRGSDEARLLRMKFAVEASDRNRALELAKTLPHSEQKDLLEAKALLIGADSLLMAEDIKKALRLSSALCNKSALDKAAQVDACLTHVNSQLALDKPLEAGALAEKYATAFPDTAQFGHLKMQADLESTPSEQGNTFEGLPLQ